MIKSAKNKEITIGGLNVDDWLEAGPADDRKLETDLRYEKKIVAFLDLLGMKHHVLSNTDGKEGDAITLIEKINGIVDKETASISKEPEFRLLHISDSFIFVCDPAFVIKLIELLAIVQMRILVECNFQLRGAITLGDVIIRDEGKQIIGPAYIYAYLMQEGNAIYPRIILQNSILAKINEIMPEYNNIIFSYDNEVCIDYLGFYIKNENSKLSDIITKLRREKIFDHLIAEYKKFNTNNQDSIKIKQKYGWTMKYFSEKGVWPDDKKYQYR